MGGSGRVAGCMFVVCGGGGELEQKKNENHALIY